jgi:YegS/Rv2252/BmrU family lipid kinase
VLKAHGCEIQVHETAGPAHATELARSAATDDVDAVVAAGGDGTINEVLNGLVGSAVPMAILPLGTANVLARELGLSLSPDAVAETIVCGDASPLPLGRLHRAGGGVRHFLMMAGIGFDARVVATVGQRLKRRLGKGAYAAVSLKQLGGFGFPRYRVEVDGAAYEAASVVVAKARYYAGPYSCAPAARLDDAYFHVCLFERGGRLAAARYAFALARGRLADRHDYRIVTGQRLTIAGPLDDPVQADGDLVAVLPITIEMVPAALRLITPRGWPHAPATVRPSTRTVGTSTPS